MTTKKVLLIIFGAVSALIGLGLVVVGVVVMAVTGGDGFFESDRTPISTSTYALVSEPATVGNDEIDSRIRVVVSPQDGPVFVGVALPETVQGYLGSSAYEAVRDLQFSPLSFRLEQHDGTSPPGPPAQLPGWMQQASGTGEQELVFDPGASTYQVVVMNADASQGVDVTVSVGVRLPFVRKVGIGVLVAAAAILALGIVLIVWGIRAKGRDPQPPAGPWGQQYVPYGPPQGYVQQGYGQQGYGYPPGAGYPPEGWQPPPPGPAPEEGAQR